MTKNIDLLREPILPALSKLALPIMATSLVQMLYNLTDMAWIGRLGADAVAAVGSASMYTWLSQGVVALPKMGGQVRTAFSLGEGRKEEAVQYAKGAIQMGILFALIYGLIAIVAAGPLIRFYGLSSQTVIKDAEIYLMITCGAIIFSFLNAIFTGLFTAGGNSQTPFKANVVGLAFNMVLDPLLIFGVGPFPSMGVAGAAVATVAAQAIVTLVFLFAAARDCVLFDQVNILTTPSMRHMRVMVKIGFPSAVQNMLFTSISMVLCRLVAAWGDGAVAVQRVVGQIESISWMTADGFAAALNSFTAQNYGGQKYQRVKDGYKTAIKIMAAWGVICTAVLYLGAEPLFRLFITEPEIVPIGVNYMRILAVCEVMLCVEITTVGAFSGLGLTLQSSLISVILTSARIPIALFLSSTPLGLNGIWWAFTVSTTLKGVVFFVFYMRTLKKLPVGQR